MRTKHLTPPEKIIRTDFILLALNQDMFEKGGRGMDRVVDLECGHKTRTRNWERAHCPRCEEMLRRSIEDGSEDYESYRAGRTRDRMEWPDDPLRQFHENILTEDS
jgi:hypothetical protein